MSARQRAFYFSASLEISEINFSMSGESKKEAIWEVGISTQACYCAVFKQQNIKLERLLCTCHFECVGENIFFLIYKAKQALGSRQLPPDDIKMIEPGENKLNPRSCVK